jgi:dihydroxy-acid dehydratase
VHTWSNVSPCNLNLRELAEHAAAGIRAAGGTPIEFNTIAVTDGIAMGTPGMRASLISREVITDSIELAVDGHCLDAMVVLCGCDKTIPAAAMALARLNIPASRCTAAASRTARTTTIRSPSSRYSKRSVRTVPARSTMPNCRSRARCLPRRRRLRRPVHRQHDGDGADHAGPVADGLQRHSGHASGQGPAAFRCGELVMECLHERKPLRPAQRTAFRNAARMVAATAGSTNAVLHLLAIAREAGIEWTLEDFEPASVHTPVIADLLPAAAAIPRWSCSAPAAARA